MSWPHHAENLRIDLNIYTPTCTYGFPIKRIFMYWPPHIENPYTMGAPHTDSFEMQAPQIEFMNMLMYIYIYIYL